MSVSTAALAAPLQEYEPGRAEVNIGTAVLPAMEVAQGDSFASSNVGRRVYGGATVGIAHNFALQYKYTGSHMSPDFPEEDLYPEIGFDTQECNLRYRVNPNVSVYMGDMEAHMSYSGGDCNTYDSRSIFQAGVQYEAKLGKDVTGWVAAGFGRDMQHYEAGIGYELARNLDLDVMYSYTKVKGINDSDGHASCMAKGLYAGLSYRF